MSLMRECRPSSTCRLRPPARVDVGYRSKHDPRINREQRTEWAQILAESLKNPGFGFRTGARNRASTGDARGKKNA